MLAVFSWVTITETLNVWTSKNHIDRRKNPFQKNYLFWSLLVWKWLEVAAMGLWHGALTPSGLSEGEGNSLHCCLQPPLCPLLGGKQPLRSDIFCKWFHKKMVRTKIPGNSFCCNPLALAIRPFTIVELHFMGIHIVYFISDKLSPMLTEWH